MKRMPNNIAVKYESECLTYSELEKRVDRLAQLLLTLGVGSKTICGVYLKRCTEHIIATLAINKAGGIYLPLEPDNPASRIKFMLRDSNAQVLLTTTSIFGASSAEDKAEWVAQFRDHLVYLDSPLPHIASNAPSSPEVAPSPEDVQYIIYTSGSTGTPKGVVVPHRGFANFLLWRTEEYKISSTDKLLMRYSIGFDPSLSELFLPLSNGGTIVIAKQSNQLDQEYLLSTIQREKITLISFTSSHINVLVDHPAFSESTNSVRGFFLGSEPVPRSLYQKLGSRMYNLYGPTETTLACATFSCAKANMDEHAYRIPIGKPIANAKIYILDSNMNPVPVGVPGELYIGGAGVTHGYLNRPELTQEKFINNIFHPSTGKMFKTGDSGVFLPNGNIEFLGRIDNQVKIGGHRIELGEIESCILQHPSIRDAVVMVVENEHQKSLVGYLTLLLYVEGPAAQTFITEMKKFLTALLPSHMVPPRFVILKEFPLTTSGKVNKNALKVPVAEAYKASPQLALSPTEEHINDLWKELDVHVSSNKQSFYDYGGSSLLAMQFLNKFQQKFKKSLPVTTFLSNPTLAGIAAYLGFTPTINNFVPRRQSSHGIPENNDIAIVGMSCRFPGGESLSQLRSLLSEGRDAVQDAVLIDSKGDVFPCRGGFISELEKFDPKLFKISPREACMIDPQQRMMLEVTWEALENAAIPPHSLKNTETGFYFGGTDNSYERLIDEVGIHDPDLASRNASGITARRIAYTLGITGPAMIIETGCSSSLVAIHQACKSLITQETDICIAGGAGIILPCGDYISKHHQPQHCKTFDVSADGAVNAEGCGVLILKRLKDALSNRDPIAAVIKGSAINQDGRTRSMSTPNGDSQVKVLQSALHAAHLTPSDISFVEAHGVGTPLGDLIEIESIVKALCGTERTNPLVVGSIKTNFGHPSGAAGVAGVIKAVLALQHNTVPQHLHLQSPNPNFPPLEGKVVFPSKGPVPLVDNCYTGVSSFGFANAHVILATAPVQSRSSSTTSDEFVIPISAASATSLKQNALRLREHLQQSAREDLLSIAYTYMVGRSHLEHRLAFVGTAEEIEESIGECLDEDLGISTRDKSYFAYRGASTPNVTFLFSAAEHGAGLNIMKADNFFNLLVGNDPIFIEAFSECTAGAVHDTLDDELALFATQYALAKMWQKRGVMPSACIGVGVGEYAAACISGVISLQDAITIFKARQAILSSHFDITLYSELVVFSNKNELLELLHDSRARIVSTYGPDHAVVVGATDDLQMLLADLDKHKIRYSPTFSRPHLQSMVALLPENLLHKYQEMTQQVTISPPTIPLSLQHSTDHLKLLNTGVTNVLPPVQQLNTPSVLLELNVSSTTSELLCRNHHDVEFLSFVPSYSNPTLSPTRAHYSQRVIAELYARGVSVDWLQYSKSKHFENAMKLNNLPTYAFERVTCWFNDKPFRVVGAASKSIINNLAVSGATTSAGIATRADVDQYASHDSRYEMSAEDANWSSTAKEIGAIWRKELMLPHVGLDDDFADIGGDSVFAMSIALQIQTKFHIKVDVDTFVSSATIRTLSKFVDMQVAGLQSTETGSSPLILIQQGTARFPLFFVHPLGGSVFKYKYLAKSLGPKYTVYGLSAQGLHISDLVHQDLAEIARKYVECIRSVQEKGPYHLGGHSLGGILALEMAQQLRAAGESVDLLAQFDTFCGKSPDVSENDFIKNMLATVLKIDFPCGNGKTWEETLEALRATGKIPTFVDANVLHHFIELWRAIQVLASKYVPRYYQGRVQFFKAAILNPMIPSFTVDSWNEAADTVDAVVVPGDHISMLEEHVDALASALRPFLPPCSP